MIFTGERARDGDYSLNDVAALRANPFHAARDFEGHADRDVLGTTIQARRAGGPVVFSSTTGFLNWKTQDVTDLDYTPRPILTRDNTEKDFQFTQEIRFASAENAPAKLADGARLRWQSGVFLFTQSYDQDAINNYSPFVVAPFAVSEHTPPLGARRLRARAVRAGHGHVQRQAGPRPPARDSTTRTRARCSRISSTRSSRQLPGLRPTRAFQTCPRKRRSATGSGPTRRCTDGRPRVQGRWLQLCVASWRRSVRRRVQPGTSRAA